MKRFILIRETDPTGISGTGLVAEGVEFTDGTVAMRWLRLHTHHPVQPTTVLHPDIDNVEALHCHGGTSRIAWID